MGQIITVSGKGATCCLSCQSTAHRTVHVRFNCDRIHKSVRLGIPKGAHNAQRNLACILAQCHQTFFRRITGKIRETHGKERNYRAHDFFLTGDDRLTTDLGPFLSIWKRYKNIMYLCFCQGILT